ncbi:hypothetical protein [Microbacterium sp. P05]
MDDRTAILLVSFVTIAGTLVAFIWQWVRRRRSGDDEGGDEFD